METFWHFAPDGAETHRGSGCYEYLAPPERKRAERSARRDALAGCGKRDLTTKTPRCRKGWFAWFLDKTLLRAFVTLWLVVSFSAPC